MSSSTVPWFAVIVHIRSYKIAFRISVTVSVFDKKMPHLLRERHLFAFKTPMISLQAIRLLGMRGFGGVEGIPNGVITRHFVGVLYKVVSGVSSCRSVVVVNFMHRAPLLAGT